MKNSELKAVPMVTATTYKATTDSKRLEVPYDLRLIVSLKTYNYT